MSRPGLGSRPGERWLLTRLIYIVVLMLLFALRVAASWLSRSAEAETEFSYCELSLY